MSYTTAVDEIVTLLTADPINATHSTVTLVQSPDRRLETLADADGQLDATFLLANESGGNPYPYAQGANPTEWYSKMRLEVLTLLHTDILAQDKTMESRARAIQEVLCFQTLTALVLFSTGEPVRQRIGEDRRILWVWRFSIRYAE